MNTAFRQSSPHPEVKPARSRYSTVAIGLHWAIALLILSMIPMGWWMVRAIKVPETQQLAYQLFQIHKSIGFTILALSVVRAVWRLTHPAPALPSTMRGWETFLARATHTAFYGLMIAIPLTGWIYVSAGWAISTDRPLDVATSWFGLFGVPHLPGLEGNRAVAFTAMGAHAWLAWGGTALIVLHVGAALKHHVIDRDGVLAQMVPFLAARGGSRPQQAAPAGATLRSARAGASRLAGLAIVAIAAVVGAALNLPGPQPIAPQTAAQPTADAAATEAPSASPAAASPPAAASSATASATASAWTIDQATSRIGFSGVHAGKPFTGQFDTWRGDIRFDPANLAGSKAVVTVDTRTVKTGDATQEGSLKNGEWFNSGRFPEARFETSAFKALGGDRYEAEGTLTLKKKPIPVRLPFRLTMDGSKARMEATLELDRAALNLGMFSDPAAEWVSKAIPVTIVVDATRSGS